jgi:hypothetical protein
MKEFEDICREYNRTDEEVEKDLRYVLMQKRDKEPIQLEAGKEYYLSLVELLKSMRCIDDRFPESVITQEGLRLIKRGYIIYDYKSPKTQEKRKIQRERLSLLIGFLGVIVGIAGLFLPRQDTVRQPIREFSKFEGVTQQDTVNLTHQIDEISQQADSTEQQNDSCKCK